MGHRFAPALVLAALSATLFVSTSAQATASEESSFVSRINAERTSRGIHSVSVRSDLVDVARRWSETMANAGQIWHDPNMPNEVTGWTRLGDCVGRGPDVASVHQAFMNSDEHRSIILDPSYNQVGVGVAWSGNDLYVTEVFVKRASSTATPTVTRHHTSATSAPRRAVRQTGPATYVVVVSDLIFEYDLKSRPVSMLEQLVGLDAARVDPSTGAPN